MKNQILLDAVRQYGSPLYVYDSNKIKSQGIGEILINTPSIMRGYFKLSSETRKSFYNGWFKTGDYGVLKPNGELTITGRIKNEINKSGLKIYPEDTDLLLDMPIIPHITYFVFLL